MKKTNPTQAELLKQARVALTAQTGFEKKAGQCKRFVRQVCETLKVPKEQSPPPVLDANQCAQWYRRNAPECIVRNGGLPGDIYFYEVGHGEHGHVGIRDFGNILIENSVAHAPEGKEEGRGVRSLKRVGRETLIVRVWKG